MTNTPFQPPTGFVSDDTVFSAPGRWRRGSMVRFFNGSWQIRGGWERLMLDQLGGVCRGVFGWTDALDVLNIAFGTHQTLEIWQSGSHADITPPYEFPPVTLGANPLATVNGSNVVTVTQAAHNYATGQTVNFTGAAVFNNVTIAGNYVITVTGTNAYTIVAGTNANATGAGGGAAVVVQNQLPFQPGAIDGTGGAGYGAGAYGIGDYGEPSTAEYWPLTWSLGAFGPWLMANPRHHSIFVWKNDLAQKAQRLAGAPVTVTYMLTVPQRQVMAFGCNEEVSGVFNPLCIRWSDIENPTDWKTLSSNNAGEYVLEGGGRIVCARVVGNYVFVWTDVALYQGTFIGAPDQTWAFEKVGENCGSISPGAPVIVGQVATWISPDVTFWSCPLGGQPKVVPCPIRTMFVDNMALGQNDKLVGTTVAQFQELVWLYADQREGLECSREIVLSPEGWSAGFMARSAAMDANPTFYPVKVDPQGNAYWHEKGHSADGAPISGFLEGTDFYANEADGGVVLNGVWPDIKDQAGVFQLSLYTRETPQGRERQRGPYPLQPGQPRRTFRVATRIVRVRLDFSSAPCYGRGGKFVFDVEEMGGR